MTRTPKTIFGAQTSRRCPNSRDCVPVPQLLVAAPMVALVTFVNRRMVQVCDACAAIVVGSSPLSKPEFCSKCGAKLADGSTVA